MRVGDWIGVCVFGGMFGALFGMGYRSRSSVEFDGRCIEACAPREFEEVVRGTQCLCKGATEVVHLRSMEKK